MANSLYLVVSGAIFLLVAVFHLFRLIYGWPIVVGGRTIPFVLSYVGLPASTAYVIWACWLLRGILRRESAVHTDGVPRART